MMAKVQTQGIFGQDDKINLYAGSVMVAKKTALIITGGKKKSGELR